MVLILLDLFIIGFLLIREIMYGRRFKKLSRITECLLNQNNCYDASSASGGQKKTDSSD